MKILAVIPARAGSIGIPNKNIRLVNHKPLIYYTIKNALDSKYITDIIVSTDSPEVEIIAKQMQVSIRKRDAKLCTDSVTLDSVIYDAAKEYQCDYVITLQPTSPTLKAGTLDQAIERCMEEGLDTLISVVNKPHLSWREENGKKVPNYAERKNRQYLPPNYIETGAFMISKFSVISETSRIGQYLDVYEISEEESVDIDTFEDLKHIEAILSKERIAFYVNGNNLRGVGHIYRALELADEFYTKPDIYYDINQTDRRIFGETTHNLIGVNSIAELLVFLKTGEYTVFVNDILATSIDYMIAVRNCIPHAKIINFEDDGEGIYKADLVINALYQNKDIPHVMTGEKYYISSKTFMLYEPVTIRERVERVFISFGGADPQNYSDRLLEIIKQEKYSYLDFIVVLGRAKKNIEELLAYNEYANIQVMWDIQNMPEIMSGCDIGITSRGRTGYELAILGIPALTMAQNEREEKHGFVCSENGFTYLGLAPSDYIIESNLDIYINMNREERLKSQQLLLSHDLRNGRKRVMNLINSL